MTLYETRLRRAVRCLRLQWHTTESPAQVARKLYLSADAIEGLLDLAVQRGDEESERVLGREWARVLRIARRARRLAQGLDRQREAVRAA